MSYNPVSGGGAVWGGITGTLSSQTDLNSALAGKQPLATVLTNTTAFVQRAFATFRTDSTPTAFKVQYSSESASSTSLKAGSYMRYRKIT